MTSPYPHDTQETHQSVNPSSTNHSLYSAIEELEISYSIYVLEPYDGTTPLEDDTSKPTGRGVQEDI